MSESGYVMTKMDYAKEIVRAVCMRTEPASVWELHRLCVGEDKELRAALRLVLQLGWLSYNEDMDLVRGPKIEEIQAVLADEAPLSVPSGVDPAPSTAHPTPTQGFPQLSLPFPTDPPKTESHQEGRTESQTHALRYAIQTEVQSLLHLEDALRTYLQAASRPGGDRVRRDVYGLLRTTTSARQEFLESDKWLQDGQPERTPE